MKYVIFQYNLKYYTLTKDGYFFIWKWVDDMLTQEYENYKKYQGFKKGKKIKVNEI